MSTSSIKYQQELDDFINENRRKFVKPGYWTGDFVEELFAKYRRLADDLWAQGEREAARDVIRSSEYMFLDFPLFESYYIQEEIYDTLTGEFAEWMSSHGMEPEIVELYEAAIHAAKTSYFHHYDNMGIRRVKNMLLDRYEKSGDLKKQQALLEFLFDTAFFGYLNDFASLSSLSPTDLSYNKPLYRELLEVYTKSHETRAAVRLINKWLFLCDRYYVDDKDTGQASDDYDEVYYDLAFLYDGTDSLIKALRAENSPFLNSPYILIAKDRDHYGYMDNQGRIILPCKYQYAWQATSKQILSVMTDGRKWIYISPDGKPIFQDLLFDFACPPRGGILVCGIQGETVIVDLESGSINQITAPCDRKGSASDGLLKIGFDAAGNNLDDDEPWFDEDEEEDEGYAELNREARLFGMSSQWHENLLCKDGSTLLLPMDTEVVNTPNRGVIMAGLYNDDGDLQYGLYDLEGNEIVPRGEYEAMLPFGDNELTPVRRDGRCGFINRKGQEVIAPKYYDARPFANGLAAVRDIDELWGFVDESGQEVVPCSYGAVSDFFEGLAWVCPPNRSKSADFNNARFGYIRKDGSQLLPPVFEHASVFYDGVAQVCQDNVWHTIDKEGSFID